jgi:hypothetical protein
MNNKQRALATIQAAMPKQPKAMSLEECAVLRDLCNRRMQDLKTAIQRCSGSLYPGIYAGQIDRIKQLFEKLTGFPIDMEVG